MTDGEKRIRAAAIADTLMGTTAWCSSAQLPEGKDEHEDLAEHLGVPVALLWLAPFVTVEQIDELVAWWPRKEGA